MSNPTPKLTQPQVLQVAQELLQEYLPLTAAGYVCTTADLYKVLLGVAANCGTLQAVCTDWLHLSEPETIRHYLNAQLCVEDLAPLETHLNQALAAQLPERLKRAPQEVARDFHDRPYYGKQPQATGVWVRGRAKDGTTHFYRIATCYVIHRGLRFTVALRFVLPEDDPVSVVQRLLDRVQATALRIACLYLDKGFAGMTVLQELTRRQIPAVIACPNRGKPGGTRALCHGNKSYRTAHTFASPAGTFTAQLAVCRVFTTAKRTKRLARRGEWLIFILIHVNLAPSQVRRRDRRRFGIESSYRCAGQLRGWTTSPNAAYRFLLLALSFVLLNVWLRLRWLWTQRPRRGGRGLHAQQFPLGRFAKFIRRALEHQYGTHSELIAVALPIP